MTTVCCRLTEIKLVYLNQICENINFAMNVKGMSEENSVFLQNSTNFSYSIISLTKNSYI